MISDAQKLRERAKHCRSLAKSILDPAAEDQLLTLADELEHEAKRLDQSRQGPKD